MMKRNRTITLAAAALVLSALGGSGMAVANASSSDNPTTSHSKTADPVDEVEGTEAAGSEGAADQAAQDAACQAAGIDPKSSNINYDDESGVCSLDSGDDGETDD